MTLEIGWHLPHEQFPPDVLLRHAQRAHAVGFAHAMCSDHLEPWSARQGESGFAWSWLGAVAATTSLSLGTVNAPGQRYHPAIVAQAAATLARLAPGRFWIALGSGENLNEHVTGEAWPDRARRRRRLQECADVMRRLWSGERVDHRGEIVVRDARLWSRPATAPLIVGAALSEESAEFAGGWADAMITAASEPEAVARAASAFARGGGAGKPVYVQAALAWARAEEEGLRAIHDQWRHVVLGPDDFSDLARPDEFDRRTAEAALEDVRGKVPVFTRAEALVQRLRALQEAGAARVYLHDVARGGLPVIETVAATVLPAFR